MALRRAGCDKPGASGVLHVGPGIALEELKRQATAADLTGVIVKAKAEARSSRPNKFKLASLPGGAATGVQVLRSMPAAWELVRAAAKAIGLM